MAKHLLRTGVIEETNATHSLTILIVNTNKTDFSDYGYEQLTEITTADEKLKTMCMLVNHASYHFCTTNYMTETLREILEEIKKLNLEEYNIAQEKYGNLNPYEPYEPFKILEKLHPNIEEFINASKNKEIYYNIQMGLYVFDALDKILQIYAMQTNQSVCDVKKQFFKCCDCYNCFDCCKQFNMTYTKELKDCMCGFNNFRKIITNLNKQNCFDNTEEFANKFLSNKLKMVGLKCKIPENDNLWQYIV